MKQATMINNNEDLPLFSGTAMRVDAPSPFAPKAEGGQMRIAVNCTACMDTGRLGKDNKRCTCKAGQS